METKDAVKALAALAQETRLFMAVLGDYEMLQVFVNVIGQAAVHELLS